MYSISKNFWHVLRDERMWDMCVIEIPPEHPQCSISRLTGSIPPARHLKNNQRIHRQIDNTFVFVDIVMAEISSSRSITKQRQAKKKSSDPSLTSVANVEMDRNVMHWIWDRTSTCTVPIARSHFPLYSTSRRLFDLTSDGCQHERIKWFWKSLVCVLRSLMTKCILFSNLSNQ